MTLALGVSTIDFTFVRERYLMLSGGIKKWFNENFVLKYPRLVVEKETGDLVYTIPHGRLEGAVCKLSLVSLEIIYLY